MIGVFSLVERAGRDTKYSEQEAGLELRGLTLSFLSSGAHGLDLAQKGPLGEAQMKLTALRMVVTALSVGAATSCGAARLSDGRGDREASGSCQVRPGAPGAEDFAIDWERGHLFVSSDDRRAQQIEGNGEDPPLGRVLTLAAEDPDPRRPIAQMDSQNLPERFHPHGIGLWSSPNGERVLMAVSHPLAPAYEGSVIEIFDVDPDGGLRHRRSVSGPWMTRPNDVAPTGRDSFYVTIEGSAKAGSIGDLIGMATGQDRSGTVWFFNGNSGRKVGEGLSFANSLALSADGSSLFATSTVARDLHVFERDLVSQDLVPVRVIDLGSGLDNIMLDPVDRMWIGAHRDLPAFVFGHARNARRQAPSQVLQVEGATGAGEAVVQEVFASDGEDLSAASVAVRINGRLILGGIYDDGLLVCDASLAP